MKINVALTLAIFGIALVPVTVRADAQQDQQACMNDAMTICRQFIPDRERVAACLVANRSHVSAECRTALTHFNPKTASAR